MARSAKRFATAAWHRLSACALLLFLTITAQAADRVVIIKVDGLPADFRERFTAGDRSKLPNIKRVFEDHGTSFENFYVRGLSLSASSWSLLDTGRHLEIRGNVEYDRYTLRPYDYLNFFPFYLGYARKRRVDMPGVELLDGLGVPLLSDRFPYPARLQTAQMLQRGVNWASFPGTLKRAIGDPSPKQVFDEWQTGLSWSASFARQRQRELLEGLKNPSVLYLDYFATEYDHMAHLNADRLSLLHELEELDSFVGEVAAGIAVSPYPESTLLVLVSDHGMNGSEGIYSQGYNLVDWFTSAAGGGHHAITNRHPLTEYKLKGLDPFVAEVVTPSSVPGYLSPLYPTVLLDVDGNERASIGFRNNTLNKLHVLLNQLTRRTLKGPVRAAALTAFFKIRNAEKDAWTRDLRDLEEELASLDLRIAEIYKTSGVLPKKFSVEDAELGLDKGVRRSIALLDSMKAERVSYGQYATIMRRLMALDPADFDPLKFKLEAIIPPKSFGSLNSMEELRHYVIGPAPGGLVLGPDGALDIEKSFQFIDYFGALTDLRVRNNVQAGIGPRPVESLAVRIPSPFNQSESVLLWRNEQQKALIHTRYRGDGTLELRYQAAHSAGMPLELWEDPELKVPDRRKWLDEWHTEREWFEAVHKTRYSNGIISVVEQLLDLAPVTGTSTDDRLRARERRLRRTDLLVFAADHWNFNVRGFNPGGNHGSFLRPSTHSVLMMAGAGIPKGVRVETPYDSLSFAPTILHLIGKPDPRLPGAVISEVAQ